MTVTNTYKTGPKFEFLNAIDRAIFGSSDYNQVRKDKYEKFTCVINL